MPDNVIVKQFGNWAIEHDDAGDLHMVPEGDLNDHLAENCSCRPELVNGLMVHHSFDGREAFETGQRLPS